MTEPLPSVARRFVDLLRRPGRSSVRGVTGSGAAWLVASAAPALDGPLLWVLPTDAAVEQAREELAFHLGERAADLLVSLPDWDVEAYGGYSPSSEVVRRRMEALIALASPAPRVVVATASGLLKRVVPPERLAAEVEEVAVGAELDRDALVGRLVDRGYLVTDLCVEPGTVAVRGGILDVFTPGLGVPVRIELWGDEVDSIRLFDPYSQRSLRPQERVRLLPLREERVDDARLSALPARLKALCDARDLPPRARHRLQEELSQGRVASEMELLLPLLEDRLVAVTDGLGPGALVIRSDPASITSELVGAQRRLEARWTREKGSERLLPEPRELFLHEDALESALAAHPGLDFPDVEAPELPEDDVELAVSGHAGLRGEILASPPGAMLAPLLRRIRDRRRQGRAVHLVLTGRGRRAQLTQALEEAGIPWAEGPSDTAEAPGPPPVLVLPGRLARGLDAAPDGPVFITEAEVFGRPREEATQRRRVAGPAVTSFAQLQRGDIVVHSLHGIGRYLGLTKLQLEAGAMEVLRDLRERAADPGYMPGSGGKAGSGRGSHNDFLLLEYRDGDKLYLPVHKLDQLTRYVAAGASASPRLDKLGGSTWQKRRKKVKEEVQRLARELLELYARRSVARSRPFAPPSAMYQEFCAGFPYELTPDQETTLGAVFEDMDKPHPMDRLVCGDVGFGKTEVAMRAAFRAIEAGRQVAVLVPTTILALQQYTTFKERMEPFAVEVQLLSRFRSAREQKATARSATDGTVDVVVGTHRILSHDLRFKNLGLLVVDEEHRFGVRHKERIKQLKAEVDVLTLTATPIPRTLHMALAGLRDLSAIHTPPPGRLPVKTRLAPFSARRIQDEVRRELTRGGQVFFVHNRVRTIYKMGAWLQKVLPELRLRVAHGQMGETELEDIMMDFYSRRFDLLLSTAIVESGIDVPTANTIIINRADAFGLAQLHQLRGRVGRSFRQGYCTLLVPPGRALRPMALERLKAVRDNSELGAGQRIAQRDLELRGAGDLLGRKQSGHIADVGLATYLELLESAVRRVRGERVDDAAFEPELEIRADAWIPAEYIEDERDRLVEYKRLADARTPEALQRIFAELEDLFGHPPEEVRRFELLLELKLLCRELRVERIAPLRGGRLQLAFAAGTPIDPAALLLRVQEQPRRFSFRPPGTLVVGLDPEERKEQLESARAVVAGLKDLVRAAGPEPARGEQPAPVAPLWRMVHDELD